MTRDDVLIALEDCFGYAAEDFENWSLQDILNYLNDSQRREIEDYLK